LSSLCLHAQAPQGWFLAGSKPADYETGVDAKQEFSGHASAYLKSKAPATNEKVTNDSAEQGGFGTLMQNFRADQYLGKRIRFSAFVKSKDVQDWAGLWMHVDKGSTVVSFDNMQDRAIKGTNDWRNYEIVLDVPQEATGIFFGILLGKTGEVWISSAKFEIVDSSVAVTGQQHMSKDAPTNLDFEKQ